MENPAQMSVGPVSTTGINTGSERANPMRTCFAPSTLLSLTLTVAETSVHAGHDGSHVALMLTVDGEAMEDFRNQALWGVFWVY